MATVTYDDRSFLVDGERIWLVSGSVHYSRIPPDLWQDRLMNAKRAGLNCISTPIPWNYHEPREGQWERKGEKDVAAFVRLAGELGLYVILRPGPYIGSQWDGGGLPGWLSTKSGLVARTNNAAFSHYFDKYFRQVLPLLADQQVTRDGNIILIQNEHEYTATTHPDRSAYLEFINQLFRRSGFDIPIINCNLFTDPPTPESVECVNGWGREVQLLKRMRLRQPNAPLLVAEFLCGRQDNWGDEHQDKSPDAVARRAMEILGCGAQYNYHMWHGGTNFGFWGGSDPCAVSRYQTQSHDFDAPLAEGGGRTRKFYVTRLVNLLANHMGRFFASSILEQPGVSVHDSTNVLNLSGPLCNWAVITNNGNEEITTARISLPEGQDLEVPLTPFGAAAVPVELDLTPTQMLDYCNLTPLGFFGQKVLAMHGPAGWDARISINGKEIQASVPKTDAPTILEHQEVVLALLNSDAAMRTWPMDEGLVIGPAYVGASIEEITHRPGVKEYFLLSPDGKLTQKKVTATRARRPTAPAIRQWTRRTICLEAVNHKDLTWQKIPGPRDADHLGFHEGYIWYRVEIDEPRAKKRFLFLPDCEDRAALFLNGKHLGVWGWGPGAVRLPISADLKRGPNALVALVDNLGRFHSGPQVTQRKGLFGHVYDAKALRLAKFKLKALDSFSKRVVPRQQVHLLPELQRQQAWSAELTISLAKVTPIHVSFQDMPHHLAILCNERMVGFYANCGRNFGSATLGAELRKGRNQVRILAWGDVTAKTLEGLKFHGLTETLSDQGAWHYRPWGPPEQTRSLSGKDLPAWFSAKFRRTDAPEPLFLHLAGAHKGQILLNGRNLGRFWDLGPQQCYYLPSCWLEDDNELLLFEEQGTSPYRSKLEFRPFGPYRRE